MPNSLTASVSEKARSEVTMVELLHCPCGREAGRAHLLSDASTYTTAPMRL